MTKTYEQIQAAIEAQCAYCAEHKTPHFAPDNGVCWSCRRQIYEAEHCDGKSYVTGCPWCSRSYCD